ncbi:MAG: hypothetical protein IT373_02375 [Polyangiaceae bacterium]|nr:hypothetical protein [Polyangiaceae bacterium]
MTVTRHDLAEERSLALHRAVAAKLRAGAEGARLWARARERVAGWRGSPLVAAPYVEAWQAWLARDLEELCLLLVAPGEHARALRQVSPFAGALDARERWRIWRSVGESVQSRGTAP